MGNLYNPTVILFRVFARSIYNQLADRIDGLVVPAAIKLRLIPIFQYMSHDSGLTYQVMCWSVTVVT